MRLLKRVLHSLGKELRSAATAAGSTALLGGGGYVFVINTVMFAA